HVMEHESFESAAIAAVLNERFVSIKVDREERPDVDRVYMTCVQATTGSGGWPMSVWLTPGLKPFYGGTYFPPASKWGRPGFVEPKVLVLRTLRAMALGGMRDHIGGGFHRYSVDAQWRVPHFEKMLYDQAQLATAFIEGSLVSGDPFYAEVAEDTLLYVL